MEEHRLKVANRRRMVRFSRASFTASPNAIRPFLVSVPGPHSILAVVSVSVVMNNEDNNVEVLDSRLTIGCNCWRSAGASDGGEVMNSWESWVTNTAGIDWVKTL